MKYNKNEVTGKMRDRIILQNVNRSRSLTGFASESWADVATIWAFAESKLPGSNEIIIEGKNTAKNICDFTIRYISSITEESRVVWGDKLYQVKNLKVSHDRRFISFQGVFYDSYILTGVNVAASVNGIAATSANLKLIMSVIGQANAIASAIGELTVFQQGVVEVAASASATATTSANVTKVINIDSSVDANANISAPLTIAKNIQSTVDANANISAELKLSKTLVSSVNATATATSILDVVTQGIVLVDASVTATGTTTANLLRIATLESSPSTAADTSAIATLTKVLEATATATAETDASAQLTIPVNASATATAETSANAQLSYTVNAEATATAETSAEAQIVRIISASATATAESSAEASFGVTFAANVQGTATVDNATIARAATMVASVTGQATVTNATLNVAAPLLLDLYPSAGVAYSLRKVRSAYTGSAIRVRRSSDNTEQDIGFTDNLLNTSALTSFVGAGNGFITTWYDQSGNGNNATQTTAANQPQIVSSGSVILLNGKPTVRYNGTSSHLNTSKTLNGQVSLFEVMRHNSIATTAAIIFSCHKTSTPSGGFILAAYAPSGIQDKILLQTGRGGTWVDGVNQLNLGTQVVNTSYLFSLIILSTTTTLHRNNTQLFNASPGSISTSSNIRIGANAVTLGDYLNGDISEIIIYESEKSGDRINIQNNINSNYGIY